MQKITKHLAAGLLLAGVTIPLASCVDDSYDMSKDIDMTMGIGSEGLKIKLGSTEKIMLADILETDGNLQTDSKNKYYLVEGGETSVNFTVSTVNAMLDNATLCPSYEVLKYDDIVPEELKGQPFEVEAGRVFDLDAPISAETEFDFDIDNIHEDVKWLKVIRPTAETSQLKFFLEIEQSAMDGIAFDNVEGLTIVFPEFIHLTNPKNGRLENNGKTFVLDNISNSGETAIELGEATLDNITFKGETGKTDNGKLAIEDKISMNGKISFKTMNAITMTQGSAVNIKLTVSIGNRIDQQSQICIANVTGRFDPTIEPEVEKIDISSSFPDFLQDDEVTVNVSNPTMKFCADMTTGIVVALVEMQNRVDMYLELVSPFHQLADKVGRFLGAVDVIHQVTHTVDDYKPDTGSVDYRLFDDFKAQRGRKLAQSGKLQVLRMCVGWQFRKSQGALHDLLAMIRTLLGVEVEDCALIIRKLGSVT